MTEERLNLIREWADFVQEDEVFELIAEVERLNEQHEGNMEALQGWYDDYQELKRENERLWNELTNKMV